MSATHAYRTLVIDDDPCVHDIFANMLSRELMQPPRAYSNALAAPAGPLPHASFPIFEVDSAFGGEQGLACVQKALAERRPSPWPSWTCA